MFNQEFEFSSNVATNVAISSNNISSPTYLCLPNVMADVLLKKVNKGWCLQKKYALRRIF